jgi:hypothetical protein
MIAIFVDVGWVGKSGHWEAKIGYDKGGGKGVLRRGGGGKGEVWIWGQDGDFWKMERKAEQTTERSGVGCGAWSGGFQKLWRNSADLCGDESSGPHGLRRGFGPVFVDDPAG